MVVRNVAWSAATLAMLAAAAPAAAAADTTQQLTALETAWSKAMIAGDAAAIGALLAPEWTAQDPTGTRYGRAQYLADMADAKVATMTVHDVHVTEVGGLAIVQGMDDETGTYKGKDTSGTYSWTDVCQKRGDKWMILASQVTKVEK